MLHPQETFAAALLGSVALSHIFRPGLWKSLLGRLADAGAPGVMILAILHLLPGAILLALAHTDTWTGIVLTILGGAWTLKGTLYLTFPEFGQRMVRKGLALSDAQWSFAGIFLLALTILALLPFLR
jgi:uncharacterized protein YjeT (DUF2065 family)